VTPYIPLHAARAKQQTKSSWVDCQAAEILSSSTRNAIITQSSRNHHPRVI
jgi:hypothetical protein